MDNKFKKILNRMEREDILDNLNGSELFSEFGEHTPKEKLIEIILKNYTLLEFFIGDLFDDDGKSNNYWNNDQHPSELMSPFPLDRKIMCADLGIDFNINIDELRKKILGEINKNFDNKDIQNKINFISTLPFSTSYSYDLKNILEYHEMSSKGKKEELVEIVAKNDLIVKYAMNKCKGELEKDDAKKICDFLSIDSKGNRDELLQRINDYVFKN